MLGIWVDGTHWKVIETGKFLATGNKVLLVDHICIESWVVLVDVLLLELRVHWMECLWIIHHFAWGLTLLVKNLLDLRINVILYPGPSLMGDWWLGIGVDLMGHGLDLTCNLEGLILWILNSHVAEAIVVNHLLGLAWLFKELVNHVVYLLVTISKWVSILLSLLPKTWKILLVGRRLRLSDGLILRNCILNLFLDQFTLVNE
jgi:hypothetical protein